MEVPQKTHNGLRNERFMNKKHLKEVRDLCFRPSGGMTKKSGNARSFYLKFPHCMEINVESELICGSGRLSRRRRRGKAGRTSQQLNYNR